ncbi:MAG: hypothetical protein PHR53_00910 [Bacteroidales bacterium]|nr:hypothetical protein [Bacteroidales bacterium]
MEIYSELNFQNGVRLSNAQLEQMSVETFSAAEHDVAGLFIVDENDVIRYRGFGGSTKYALVRNAVGSITVGDQTITPVHEGNVTFAGSGITITANEDAGVITFTHPNATQTNTTSSTTLSHGGTFSVIDSVTRNTQGHVTGVNVKTFTLPSDNNTDTKVTVAIDSASNANLPLLFATGNTGYTGTVKMRAGVTVNPSTGVVTAQGFSGNIAGNATTATTLATARAVDGVNFNGSSAITHYTICSTVAGTAAKTASLNGFVLATGAHVTVRFTVTNTAANPTLNINGTGAKPIYYHGAAIIASALKSTSTYDFVYNGTNYEFVGDINTNSTYGVATSEVLGLVKSGGDVTVSSSGIMSVGNNTHNHYTNTITALSGYVIAGSESALAATDTLNQALGKIQYAIDNRVKYANLSFALGGIDIATWNADHTAVGRTGINISGSISSSDDEVPTSKAVVDYVNDQVVLSGSMRYKGTLGTGGTVTALPAIHAVGDVYMVKTAGAYGFTVTLEVGDMVICNTVGSAANVNHWDVIQGNITGAVTSESTLTNNKIILGAGSKSVKASSYSIYYSSFSDSQEVVLAASAINSHYVRKAGSTMTGYLTLHAAPTENNHAATKQYVDSACGSGLHKYAASVNGTSGSIQASAHGCGSLPFVFARSSSGALASLSFVYDASGNISWRSTATFSGQIIVIG